MDPTGQKPGPPPGGWSADPYGSGTSKWGDSAGQAEGDTGTQSPLAARIPGLRLPRPMLGAHVPVYTPYIWMLLAVPVLAARGDIVRMVAAILHAGSVTPATVVLFSTVISFGATGLLGYLDWRKLRGVGVVRPFHWIWAFLPTVYVIGRTTVIRKVAPRRGLAPVWVLIASFLLIALYLNHVI